MLLIKLNAHVLISGVSYGPGDVISDQATDEKKRSLVEHGKARYIVSVPMPGESLVEVAKAVPRPEMASVPPRRRVKISPAGGGE